MYVYMYYCKYGRLIHRTSSSRMCPSNASSLDQLTFFFVCLTLFFHGCSCWSRTELSNRAQRAEQARTLSAITTTTPAVQEDRIVSAGVTLLGSCSRSSNICQCYCIMYRSPSDLTDTTSCIAKPPILRPKIAFSHSLPCTPHRTHRLDGLPSSPTQLRSHPHSCRASSAGLRTADSELQSL